MNDEINRKWYHDQVLTKVLYPKYYKQYSYAWHTRSVSYAYFRSNKYSFGKITEIFTIALMASSDQKQKGTVFIPGFYQRE